MDGNKSHYWYCYIDKKRFRPIRHVHPKQGCQAMAESDACCQSKPADTTYIHHQLIIHRSWQPNATYTCLISQVAIIIDNVLASLWVDTAVWYVMMLLSLLVAAICIQPSAQVVVMSRRECTQNVE